MAAVGLSWARQDTDSRADPVGDRPADEGQLLVSSTPVPTARRAKDYLDRSLANQFLLYNLDLSSQ